MMRLRWRLWLVSGVMLLLLAVLMGRVTYINLTERQFLIRQGDLRSVRELEVMAHRGMIVDRHGQPLAVSTPVVALWGDPRHLDLEHLPALAAATGVSLETLAQRHQIHRAFFYIRRQLAPEQAQQILDLNIPGVYARQEFRRFYPAGEILTHVLGFTNIDDHGQEGIELAYNDLLTGQPGRDLVLQNRNGQVVRHVETLQPPHPGQTLQLTIDLDLQYQVYRALKNAWARHQADWASVVVMDVRTGDILAMANVPSFNPNDRSSIRPEALRNRAVSDAIEPGSVIKTFALAGALVDGVITPSDTFNTSPGRLRLASGHQVRDFRDYGVLDVTGVLARSSNVGTARIAMEMGGSALWAHLFNFGFGQTTNLGLPGESAGVLPNRSRWADIQVVSQSYGYGMTATPLQLTQAYAALANQGVMVMPRILNQGLQTPPRQVLAPEITHEIQQMLIAAMQEGGTGTRARMPLFSAAGKTGTAITLGDFGYNTDAYRSVFAGYAPAHDPRLAVTVVVENPRGEEFFGGAVAGPVFAEVMQAALSSLGVRPDQWLQANSNAQQGGRP